MRTRALWAQSALAALVGIGVVVQVYLIAAYIFGADALDAHQAVGNVVLALEVLVLIAGLAAWWGEWPAVLASLALPVVGGIQVALSGGEKWVGGLHGLLALVVLALAALIHVRAMRAARASGPHPIR